jgi:DNA-binding NarL/FixJ family response regulator
LQAHCGNDAYLGLYCAEAPGKYSSETHLQTTAQLTAFALETIRTSAPMHYDLTPREAEIVRFVAHGLTSKEIARRLRISPLTVRKHRENAMRNLGVHTMADLMDAARSVSLTDTLLEA